MSELIHSDNRIQPVSDEQRAELLSQVYAIILSPEWEKGSMNASQKGQSKNRAKQTNPRNEQT